MKKQFLSIAFACTVALDLVGCASTSSMTIKDNKPKDEAAIRELMRPLSKALRAKDIIEVYSCTDP